MVIKTNQDKMKKEISYIDSLTIRNGKLIMSPIKEDGKHPYNWEEFKSPFVGRRIFALKSGERWLYCTISWDSIYNVTSKNNPKKIFVQTWTTFYGSKYTGFRGGGSMYVNLEDVYVVWFEDSETKKKFRISNIDRTLDCFLPGDEIKVYWRMNPWAGNGTGWKDWTDPRYVDVLHSEFEIVRYTGNSDVTDLFDAMERAERNIESNLENLANYTGLNFNLVENEKV